MKLKRINEKDNVAVALEHISKGYIENGITVLCDIPKSHKVLLCDGKKGDFVIKYGQPIGQLTEDTKKGSLVHSHNLKTNLSSSVSYIFSGDNEYLPKKSNLSINAYKRKDDKIGIRNEVWIIPTVGCVNKTCEALAKIGSEMKCENCDGVFAYTHPYGCSQMGEDSVNTKRILSALITHPNAGGVLVVSLGCEDNNVEALKPYLSGIDESRVKFMCCQEVDDELAEGELLLKEIFESIKNDTRQAVGIENLVVGYKCGGSDAFSGITANPLCGKVNDILACAGATTVLTETPEMFGAEQLLMNRAENKEVFDKIVDMINGYKQYFAAHGQVCYENPSFGNREGGITTLEEKSLGCIKKGGEAVVTDVLSYGEKAKKKGLNLLYGPGNDIVSTTNLVAAGAHIILFTTGRGTGLGAPVPTIKIASNSALAEKKQNWIDFDAQKESENELLDLIIQTANGKETKNEKNGYREIAIFKNGVTM